MSYDPIKSKTDQLVTHAHEYVKSHTAYDAQDRVEYVYTAAKDAPHGGPCIVTRYAYLGTTARVTYMKEDAATWDVAWEAF